MKQVTTMMMVCFSIIAFAQKPEPILSFAMQLKPVSWYSEQANLWKKETEKDPSNSVAWYNYYRATRNRIKTDTTDKGSLEAKNQEMRNIMEEMEKKVPQSFDYNLVKWMVEGNNMKYISFLKKAEELGSDRTEHFSDMLGWGEITRNIEKRDKYAKLWLEKAPYSPGLLIYNHNVLVGLKPNAILITTGDNDTYPCWLIQSKGFRRDVTIINTSLILIDEYRNALFKELGVVDWKSPAENSPDSVKKAYYNKFQQILVKSLAHNSQNRPVYVALTCSESYCEPLSDSLYLTGLAYEYSPTVPDNIALLRKNFEQQYALEYLELDFVNDISAHYTNKLNFNYIVPLLKLYDHYYLSNDLAHLSKTKSLILAIAKGRTEETDIKKHLSQYK